MATVPSFMDVFDTEGMEASDVQLPQGVEDILEDPLKFQQFCWPHISFYDDQIDIIKSVQNNAETIVPAGNMLGKDFVSGFIALWWFCSRVPSRVVTTSVDYSQLSSVLWGEIRRFLDESTVNLGLRPNNLLLRQVREDGSLEPRSQLIGRVAQKGEGMLGRHLERGPYGEPRTLAIIDEASGFDDVHYDSISTWAHRILIIGNPFPCENFFKKFVKSGDVPDPDEDGAYYRKVIQIKAERSPNVRLAEAEIALGKKPSHREVVPGVMSYKEYRRRRATWDPHKQSVGLDAEFYEGEDIKMYPMDWLEGAHAQSETLYMNKVNRHIESIGVDVAEGGDSTVWTTGDKHGIVDQISKKTKNTSDIFGTTVSLIENTGVDPRNVVFDLGGGGKEHVDYLNDRGYPVRGVYFGSAPTPDPDSHDASKTSKGGYKNRRAEMYGLLRNRIKPGPDKEVFGIPRELEELTTQLKPIPLWYDSEGRIYLPPKNKPNQGYTGVTLVQLIGHSPDEADSCVLMVYGLEYPVYEITPTIF